MVIDHSMQVSDTTALRLTCREGRAIADATIASLEVDYVQRRETRWTAAGDRGVGARQFAAFIRGILARGAVLKTLKLHPVVGDVPCANQRVDAPENEDAA